MTVISFQKWLMGAQCKVDMQNMHNFLLQMVLSSIFFSLATSIVMNQNTKAKILVCENLHRNKADSVCMYVDVERSDVYYF